MNALDKLGWEILNATADDCENLEQIYLQLSYERHAKPDPTGQSAGHCFRPALDGPLLNEIASRVRELVEADLLAVTMDEDGGPWVDVNDQSFVWRGWFQMTSRGRSLWESSDVVSTS